MTPEEIAVINTAIRWTRSVDWDGTARGELIAAVNRLIGSCQECNHDIHRCLGCGEPIGHGEGACKDCDLPAPMTVSEREEPADDPPSGVAGPLCGAQSRPDTKLSCVLPSGHPPINPQGARSLHTGVASDGSRRNFWVWSV